MVKKKMTSFMKRKTDIKKAIEEGNESELGRI